MTAAAELFPRRHPKRTYNEFDRDTERELAACFKRLRCRRGKSSAGAGTHLDKRLL